MADPVEVSPGRWQVRRCVCAWCPMELPDDPDEWTHHFVVAHRLGGYSVRFYPALTEAEELAAMGGLNG